jgi:hypothetical protein
MNSEYELEAELDAAEREFKRAIEEAKERTTYERQQNIEYQEAELRTAWTYIAELQAQLDEARNLLQSAIKFETGLYTNWIPKLRTVLDDPDATPPGHPADGKWGHSAGGELYSGDYANKEDAIRDCESPVYIGQYCWHPFSWYAAQAGDILEACGERAYDAVGDAAEGWPPQASSVALEELNKALRLTFDRWATRWDMHPDFCEVEAVEKIEEDPA